MPNINNCKMKWDETNFQKVYSDMRKTQYRIYKAKRNGNQKLVVWLQKHLINGIGSKIIAVHQITSLNKTARVDKVVNLTDEQKMCLAMSIRLNGVALKQPLGIST